MSVNTDDPGLLRTTLVAEYQRTARAHGWDLEALRAAARTSIDASFCSDEIRQGFLGDLEA